jgi:murein L,D-transpeptidase YafK
MKIYILCGIILSCGIIYGYLKFNRFLLNPTETSTILSEQEIKNLRQSSPINEVHVYKSERRLHLLSGSHIVRSYDMRLGFDPIGHKVKEGDGKTPEGRYVIDWRNPNSQFYKSLHISYPNATDIAKAKQLGVSPGGDIMIHGSASTKQLKRLPQLMDYLPKDDWTWGCIAVRNVDMDEIWKLVDNGTPIEIYP